MKDKPFGFKQRCHQYIKETSLHGLRYLAEAENPVERVVWFVAILAFLIFAGVYTIQAMNYSYNHPIITSISTSTVKEVTKNTIKNVLPGISAESTLLFLGAAYIGIRIYGVLSFKLRSLWSTAAYHVGRLIFEEIQ